MLNKMILSVGISLIVSTSALAAQQTFQVCNTDLNYSNTITVSFPDGSKHTLTPGTTEKACYSPALSGKSSVTFNITSPSNPGSCSVTISDLSKPTFTVNGNAGFCMTDIGTLSYNSNVEYPTFDVNLD